MEYLQEDIRNVNEINVYNIFDYSPTLTYGDVVYNQLYGYVNATLGFTSRNQESCLDLIKEFQKNFTVTLPDLYRQ